MKVFYHGVMGSGKTTMALQTYSNYRRIGQNALLVTSGERDPDGVGLVRSRLGVWQQGINIKDLSSIESYMFSESPRLDVIVADEVQLYSPQKIELLGMYSAAGVSIYAFGLYTDFLGNRFPAVEMLEEGLGFQSERLQLVSPCQCGLPAEINSRWRGGTIVLEGDPIEIGDVGGSNSRGYQYIPLCIQCFSAVTMEKAV